MAAARNPAPRRKPAAKSFPDVIKSGEMVASVEAMRDQIAADIASCESMRDKAALYTRLAQTLDRLHELKPETPKGDAIDEIAARRASRRPVASARQARTKRSS
jgi:hypothetical protein